MQNVLVTYASTIGPTAAIARAIGEQLTERGFDVDVRPTSQAQDAGQYDAVVVGSSVHLRRWNTDALHYLADQAPDLAERPTWLFQTCALRAEAANHYTATPRGVFQLCQDIGADLPRTFVADVNLNNSKSRLARLLSRGDLAGQLHDYGQIRDWADTIADRLHLVKTPSGS
jgi:menaquinone-dependent protoporphyrinogen oxidase